MAHDGLRRSIELQLSDAGVEYVDMAPWMPGVLAIVLPDEQMSRVVEILVVAPDDAPWFGLAGKCLFRLDGSHRANMLEYSNALTSRCFFARFFVDDGHLKFNMTVRAPGERSPDDFDRQLAGFMVEGELASAGVPALAKMIKPPIELAGDVLEGIDKMRRGEV